MTYILEPRCNEIIQFNIACNKELFPHPTSPIMHINSPCFISKFIFFNIGSNGFIFFFSGFIFGGNEGFIDADEKELSKPRPPSKSIAFIFSSNLSFFGFEDEGDEDVDITDLLSILFSFEFSSLNLI